MLEFADWYDYRFIYIFFFYTKARNFSPLYDELANQEAPIDDGWTLTLPSGWLRFRFIFFKKKSDI